MCHGLWFTPISFRDMMIFLLSHTYTDSCGAGDQCLVVNDHNRPVNVYGYDPKAGFKGACIVNATVAYTESESCQVIIFLLNQAIEVKSLEYHHLCPMQCCIDGVLIDEVPKFLAPVLSKIMHPVQIVNPFNATHPIIIPLEINRVTGYFDVRKSTQEEYEDESIFKIELMVKGLL